MKPPLSLLPLLLLLTTCQKPNLCPEPPAPSPVEPAPPDAVLGSALTIQAHYHPQSCRTFFDARISNGILTHDDTIEAAGCQSPNQPFSLQPFIFPVATPDGQIAANYKGLRLESLFPLSSEGFQLSTTDHPNLQEQAAYVYAFTTHSRYTLQIFFPETVWDSLITINDQLNFSFQVTNTFPQLPKPTFTLIQGQYEPETRSIHFTKPPAPGSRPPATTPAFQFHLIDSIHTLRIRSIYTLLTEDFAVWTDDTDCQDLQNWDFRLILAAGYNLLEIQFDPPYLECLKEQGIIHFRVALLR